MKKIFVMGGGGFSMEPENLLLDRYILSLPKKTNPKICFIGTASGDSESYRDRFYDAYKKLPCVPSHLSLFKPHTRDLQSFVEEQDIIHVGGGNTKNLICLWKEWKLDQFLLNAYQNGTVMSGISAGMICWFQQGLTDSAGVGLDSLDCLGFLQGSACPHFDGEAERKPTYLKLIVEGKMMPGLALDDGAGALFLDGELKECVSSRPNSKAFRISHTAEEALPIKFLGL